MPKKIFLLLVVGCWILTFPVFAQESVDQPTCDLCGWCNQNIVPPQPSPQNWNSCMTCLYPTTAPGTPTPPAYYPPPLSGNYYTVFGCWSTNAGDFTNKILKIVFGMAGGIAFLAFLGGSGLVLTSSGDPQRLQMGKETIASSVLGILLIVFSVFLLRMVGFEILNIPGFG